MKHKDIKMNEKQPPRNFASASTDGKVTGLMTEIATRARSIDFFFFGGFLPNPDPILRKMGKDQLVYEEILGDGHLSGVIASRTAGVKSLLWAIDRGKAQSRATKAIQKAFESFEMDHLITEILEANYRGYQPLEVLWGKPNADGLILPTACPGKPPEWFQFDAENQLRFRTLTNWVGEELPPRKFLLARRKPTFKNPYGDALLSKCYWPAVFKRSGLKFWVTFVEKYGIPFAVGKVPRGAPEKEYSEFAKRLADMVQDAVAAIPDDSSIELIEPQGRSSSGEIFERLIQWANAEMSKAIIGHSGGADSTPGKLGGEDGASEVKQFLIDEDKRLVESVINQLIKWIFEINFGSGAPPVFSMYEEEDVDLDQATRDKSLSDQGVQFSKEYYLRAYGFEEGDIVSVGPPKSTTPVSKDGKPTGPNFSERKKPLATPDQAALDSYLDGINPLELQSQADGILKPIIDMVDSAWSLEDIRDNLAGTFSDLDSSSLEKMLQRAIFVSELLGRVNGNR